MKKTAFYSTILLLGLFLGITINSSGQTTIWSEDFSTYVEGTGIDGTGNIGDYPAGVTKWTLDVSGCTLDNDEDYIKTDYEKLKSRDLDGPAVWQSESIDLTAYSTGATFSIKFYEYSSMEPEDYIDVHYQLNGGDFVLIPNWNGHGSDIHTLIDDFSKDTVVQSVSTCNNLVIKVTFNNNSDSEEFQMDDVFLYPNMEYSSSTTTQNTHKIAAGKTNQQIIGMEIITTGTESPISITQFTINTNGSSTPVSNNIENAKIYYTGIDNTFATGTQFGSTYALPTTTNFDITGTQQLSEGTNYFWLTFNTKTGATLGELIDAECISFVIDGSTETPTITAPAGSRIIAAPLSGNYTIGTKSNYASFTAAVSDLNNLGISGSVSFSVASGTYTEQISFSAIDGTSATDTIIFQSSTSNYADVTLQFTQTSTANYVVNFDGSDYISFLDMTIQSTGSSSYGKVFVFKGTTQNISLKDNNINGRNVSSQSNNYAVIYGEGGTSNMASNINIENDTIRYGSKGISFEGGDASNLETGNSFRNNAVENFYYSGIETGYQDAVVVNQNRINSKGVSTIEQGIKTYYCNNDIEITRNRVLLSAADENTGIELNSCYGTTAMPGLIANNFTSITVATFTTAGISIENSGHQYIYHNSINAYSSSKNNSVFRSGTQAGVGVTHYWPDALFEGLKIINNIVSGALKSIDVSQTTADEGYLESSDNNDWFTLSSILGSWGSINCPDLAAWQAVCGMDGNSVSVDPDYISNESPAIGNQNLKESVPEISEVPKDIDNMPRRNPTTPGAKKFCCVWKGTVSSNWNDPSNWNFGQVPTLNDDVCIDAMANYQPDLLSDAECRDLLMQQVCSLNANNYNLTTTGNVHISEASITNDNQLIFGGGENTEFMPGTQRYN
nr:hypothetical protein [Bacteroidota bacterium]